MRQTRDWSAEAPEAPVRGYVVCAVCGVCAVRSVCAVCAVRVVCADLSNTPPCHRQRTNARCRALSALYQEVIHHGTGLHSRSFRLLRRVPDRLLHPFSEIIPAAPPGFRPVFFIRSPGTSPPLAGNPLIRRRGKDYILQRPPFRSSIGPTVQGSRDHAWRMLPCRHRQDPAFPPTCETL